MTGIMMLFDVGLALTSHSLFEDIAVLEPYQDVVNSSDRLFLKMLTQQPDLKAIGVGHSGDSLCQQVLCRIHGTGCRSGNTRSSLYASLESFSTSMSAHSMGVWSSSCILERDLGSSSLIHRLVILPSRERFDRPYEIYSCIVTGKSVNKRCSFELGA